MRAVVQRKVHQSNVETNGDEYLSCRCTSQTYAKEETARLIQGIDLDVLPEWADEATLTRFKINEEQNKVESKGRVATAGDHDDVNST